MTVRDLRQTIHDRTGVALADVTLTDYYQPIGIRGVMGLDWRVISEAQNSSTLAECDIEKDGHEIRYELLAGESAQKFHKAQAKL